MRRRAFLKRTLLLSMPFVAGKVANALVTTAGSTSYPRSAAETAAGIEPVDLRRPPGNVMRYGATGNGTSDDTAAINSALSVAQNIYFPPGTYMIRADGATQTGFNNGTEGGLIPRSNQRLTLDKRATLKAITNGAARYNVIRCYQISNVVIEGGTIHGNRNSHSGSTGEWGHGIGIWDCNQITIRNCIVRNCWGDGVFVDEVGGARSTNIIMSGVRCTNNRRNGCSIVSALGVRISNSTFDGQHGTAPQAGLWVEPDTTKSVSDVIVLNCDFYENIGPACGAALVKGVLVSRVTFDACHARNCQFGFVLRDVTAGNISNCVATGCDLHGIQIEGVSHAAVSNCISSNNGRDGLRISHGSFDFTVTGCVFFRNGRSTFGNGLVIVADSTETRVPSRGAITGCTFRENNLTGVNITTANDVKVLGNVFIGNGQAADASYPNLRVNKVRANYANDILIERNTFLAGALTNQPDYHIKISAGNNCRITANDLSDPAAAGSITVSAGSGNQIRDNKG